MIHMKAPKRPLDRSIAFALDSAQQPRRSHLRTAAIVAGNAGLAYGGIKIGQAANEIRRAATKAHGAAAHTEAITGTIHRAGSALLRPVRSLKRVVRLSTQSLRKDIVFAVDGTSVAKDRYRKAIKEHESDRAESNYTRSALTGAAVGALLRKPPMKRGRAALLGGAAGLGVQAIARAATASSKDSFGDRPLAAKRFEKVPWQAGAVAAGVLAHRKLRTKIGFSSGGKVLRFDVADAGISTAKKFADLLRSKWSTAGAAIGGVLKKAEGAPSIAKAAGLGAGIAAADTVTSAALPEKDKSRVQSAASGLARGSIYGGALVASEPFLTNVVKRFFSTRHLRKQVIQFGGREQLRDRDNRYVDPLKVASGAARAYAGDREVNLPVQHAQVVRAALHKGQSIHRAGTRVGSLLKDAAGAATGQRKLDARGRPQKREWEKSWFRNAVGTAATAGALLGHASLMRRNPGYRRKVAKVVGKGKTAANQVIPDLFPTSMSAKIRSLRFDATAPSWDVRDERGRSARVFAPGAQRRKRREKKAHEKVSFIRKAAVLGALAAAVGGGAVGYKVGARRGLTKALTPKPVAAAAKVIPFPKTVA